MGDDDDDEEEGDGAPREKKHRVDRVPDHWKGDSEIKCDFCPAMVSGKAGTSTTLKYSS